MKEFSYQLHKIMELRGITQTDLCEKTGIPKSAMSQYLSGSFRPKQERTYLLAKALNTSPEYLMGLTDDPETGEPVDERTRRIKEAIENSGLSYPELERLTGISKSLLQRYATGITKNIPIDCVEKIAAATKTDARYLMCWDDSVSETYQVLNSLIGKDNSSKQVQDEMAAANRILGLTNSEFDMEQAPSTAVYIPVVGEVAAGYQSLAEMQVIDRVACDASLIRSGYDYVYLRVKGDSMEPKICEGDLVLVQVQDTIDSGDYAVVLVDDDNGLVKRVEFDRSHLTLISENPYYPPRKFLREEMNRVRIFGKVIKAERFF